MKAKKENNKRPSFPLSTKIIIIVLVSVLCSTIFIGVFIYRLNEAELISSLKDSLEGIAVTASLIINGEMHNAIVSADSDTYRDMQLFLRAIKEANGIKAPICTFKKGTDRNKLECVITTEPVNLMGTKYRMPDEADQVFKKSTVDSTGLYQTKTGIWVSAYAPIKDIKNKVVAVLKVQRYAGYIQKALLKRLFSLILFCAIAFSIGSILSIFLIKQVTTGIRNLDGAVLSLERGNYDTNIEAPTNDEIGHLAQTFNNMRLSLKKSVEELKGMWLKEKKAHLESILTLSKAIEIRDPYTRGHIERVSQYSVLIAKKLGISDQNIEELQYGCMLHDLGKLGVNIDVLEKPVKLNAEEQEKIRMHPIHGAEILKDIEFLKIAREITLYHHERFDGKGYPYGLKGEKIPLLARIVSLADAFDAMVTDRPYRKMLSDEEAFSIIKSEAGKQFDPQICYVFFELRNEIIKIRNHYKNGGMDADQGRH